MGVARIRRIAEELIAGGLLARHAGGRGAVGHPTRAAHRAGHARHDRRPADLATPSVIVVGRGGRRRPGLVRAAAALRPEGRRHPHPPPGVAAHRRAARRSGRIPIEVPGDRDRRPGRRRRGARGGRRRGSARYDWVVVTSPNGAQRLLAAVPDARAFGGPRWPPSARARRRCWRRGHPGRPACPSASWPRPSSRRCRTGRGGCSSPAPRWRATSCPTACGPRAGRSTSSTPTARVPAPVTDEQRAAVAAADVDHVHLVVHRRPLRGGLRRRRGSRRSVACIGPITAATARAARPRRRRRGRVHTIDGLVAALAAWATDHPRQ